MRVKPLRSTPACIRSARAAERVRRLQDTAADMFLSCGYEGMSLDRLLDEVGGSRRNVYGVYGGKQGLFAAAVRSVCEEVGGQLTSLVMPEMDVRAGLLLYGRRLLELLLQPRMLAMHRLMVAEGQRFPEQARSMCETGPNKAALGLGLWLAGHQARGVLRPQPAAPQMADSFIHLIVAGPQLRALLGELPPGWTPAGIAAHVESTVELFLHGAAAPAPTNPAARKTRT